jgi:hypothetical protein
MASKNPEYTSPCSSSSSSSIKHSSLRIDERDTPSLFSPTPTAGMKRLRPADVRKEKGEMDQWLDPNFNEESYACHHMTEQVEKQKKKKKKKKKKMEVVEEEEEESDDSEEDSETDGNEENDDEEDLVVAKTTKGGSNAKLTLSEITKKVLEIPMEEDDSGNIKGSMLWKLSKASYHLNFHVCSNCKNRINKIRSNGQVKENAGNITFKIPFCDQCVRLNMSLSESSSATKDVNGDVFYRNGQTVRLSKLLPKPTTTLSLNLCKECNKKFSTTRSGSSLAAIRKEDRRQFGWR